MSKTPFIAAAVLAAGLACGSAQARDVYWSVGINAPLNGVGHVGTVVGNYPGQAVVYQPAYQPVYQPVYQYRPAPVVYYPAPVVYPAYGHGHRHHPHWDRRDHRRSEWRDNKPHRHHGR
ncbi:MAG: hypothetical protein IV092_14565 [Burkholderiaceae bacterium]|nr:hypothetical protein [Burkholderiaceae bacterium]